MNKIKTYTSEECVIFSISEDNALCVFEMTRVEEPQTYLMGEELKGSFLYFVNRIRVPDKLIGKGFGSALMKKAVEVSDKENIQMFIHVSPYGTGLNKEELLKFYKRYGFVETPNLPGACMRVPNKQ